jgi:protein N-terminal methyltransferase
VNYWDRQEASYDGVLGGFGFVSDYDIMDSKALLQRVRFWQSSFAGKTELQQAAAAQEPRQQHTHIL